MTDAAAPPTSPPTADESASLLAIATASEQRYRALFESMNEGHALHELIYDVAGNPVDYRFLEVNPAFGRLTGLDPAAIAGRTVKEIIPGIEAAWIERYARVVETGESVRFEMRAAPLGRWYEVFAYRPAPGRFAVSFSDITDRKQAEERAEFLARFPQENPDPVIRLSRDFSVLYANAAALGHLGAIGLAIGSPGPEPLVAAARRALAGGRRLREELVSGQRVFAISVVPVGEEVNVYGQDVTERKRAQLALAELARRKDEFIAMMSHELRNPLAPIRNAVAILERASPTGEQAGRAKAIIKRQVEHLSRLVDDLLDVTRISRGGIELEQTPLDLIGLVQRTVEDHRPLMSDRGLALELEHANARAWILGDATRLTQVIGNVLQNAAKFTDRGGRVTVTVTAEGGEVAVRIADTGAGIRPELLERIFEPFVQGDSTLARTKGGLGLGLALAKGLVERHGGTLRAHSDGPGAGAEIVMTLPVACIEPVIADAVERDGRAGRLVVVIEDNLDAGESLVELLELSGHRARLATTGRNGIALGRQLRPDAVVCDVGLPDVSGYEVARALRADAELAGMQLIALTGYARPDDRRRALEAGFDAHLPKPPALEELERLLAQAPARAR